MAIGTCEALGASQQPFDGQYTSWQTGGAGAGTIAASSIATYGQYPPATINGLTAGANQALLPTYTSTSAIPTLPPPTFSPSPPVSVGDGWYDTADTGLAPTEVQGCSYPNAWDAVSSPVPIALCPPGTVPVGVSTTASAQITGLTTSVPTTSVPTTSVPAISVPTTSVPTTSVPVPTARRAR